MTALATIRPVAPLQRTLAQLTCAGVQIAFGALGVAEESLALYAAVAALAGLGWFLTEPGRSRPSLLAGLPKWLSVSLLLLVLAGSVYRVVRGTAPVSTFESFLAALIVLKMWERRHVRDYRQVLALVVFLVIGTTLNATSIWIGVLSLALLPVLVSGVMLSQIVAAAEGSSIQAGAGVARGVGVVAATSVLLGVGLAAVVFVIVPRGEEFRRFGLSHPALSPRVTAFTDEVNLNRGGLISESQAKVLELRVRDDVTGAILGGEGQRYYLRGVTLTNYASGRWQRTPPGPAFRTRVFESGQVVPVFGELTTAKVVLLEISSRGGPSVDSPIFTMLSPLAVYLGEVDRPIKCTVDPETGDIFRPGRPEPLSYRVRAAVTAPAGAVPVARDRTVSFPSARVHDLAVQVLRAKGLEPDPARREPESDMSVARALEAHLRSNYAYTLSPPTPPLDTDPIEFFLFTSRRGHCEFFASALAALCRSVGVDARLVAGYLASEFDEADRRYIVRESAAHAWVEARAGSGAWVTLDATPPSQFQAVADGRRALWARLARFWERVEAGWNSSVTSFDESTQRRLWGEKSSEPGPVERLGQFVRARRDWLANGPNWWGVVIAGVILAAAGVVSFWKRGRTRRADRSLSGAGWALSPPARAILADLSSRLNALEERRPPAEPLATFVRAVAARRPDLAADLQLIADALYRDAFDTDHPGTSRRLAEARQALRRLRPRRP